MRRGITPRQPARTGRQEGVRASRTKTSRDGVSTRKEVAGSKRSAKPAGKTSPKVSRTIRKAKKLYDPLAPERIKEIVQRLDKLYPDVTCALTHKSAWELLVATILSAQSTDVRVNMVTPALFKKYPTVEDFAALQPEDLQADIRSTGFFRNKSKSVVGAAKRVVSEFKGQVPETMEELLTLPGVARKTANVVLGTWFAKGEGIVVDTHVHRISRRLELTQNHDPQKIERDLMQVIPPEKWIIFAHQLIWHGRKLCIARRPKCAECPLETICHAADKTWTTVEVHPEAKA